MLLTFSVPGFDHKIKKGLKIHTIRVDKNNRWKIGMKIHFWMGNPRNVKSKNKPFQFGIGIVKEVREIEIYPSKDLVVISGTKICSNYDLNYLAKSDGFNNWIEMKDFFKEDFKGKLIFWKDCNWL